MNAPASSPASALPADAVEVGRVIGAWGVKGGFKVKPFAASPQALFSSKRWYLQPAETARPPGTKPPPELPNPLRIVTAREQGDGVVATAQDIDDRDAAEALKGARVYVARSSFPTPDENEFYWVDLIGLDVSNREAVELGRVIGLIETGPHCVLRIQPADAKAAEVLVPFVDVYVDRVDMPGRRIHVDWDADDGA